MTDKQRFDSLDARPAFENSDSEFKLLGEVLATLASRWKILVLAVLIGLGVGVARYLSAPVVYESTAQIQIERRSPDLLGNQSVQLWWNPEFYPTQEQLLRGRGLAEAVTKRLVLWNDPAFRHVVESSTYVADSGTTTPADDDVVTARIASQVRSGLRVSQVQDTQLFDLTYRSTSPETAMKLANGYAESFIETRKESSRADAAQASSEIANEIEALESEIETLEQDLLTYSQSSDIVAPNEETNVTLQRLTSANQAFLEAQRKRIEAQAEYNELANRSPEDLADSRSGGLVSTQRSELIALQREYDAKLETYRADFPTMVELNTKITEAQRQLDKLIEESSQQAIRSARARYQQALQAERSLEREYDAMKEETRRYQSASSAFQNLTGDIAAKRDTLSRLRRTQSQANVGSSSGSQSVVVQTERALLPTSPVSPVLRVHLPGGVLFGLLCGIGLILLLDFLDRSIKTPEELERRLDLPVLGVIPDVGRRGREGRSYGAHGEEPAADENLEIDLLPHIRPKLPTSEAYRALRTATLLSRADEPSILAVTSTSAREGKTATAMNLGVVMAQLGRRTLLVDADLRKPRLHESLGVSNLTGLVNCLVQHAEVDSVVQSTKVPDLWVLPSGPLPPNPSELLSSTRMTALIEELRGQFDMILIDTPPVLAVTDAMTVAVRSEGLLLCVRSGKEPRDLVQRCALQLRRAGVPLLGTVFNAHRMRGGVGKYGSYGYGYGYADSSATPSLQDDVA